VTEPVPLILVNPITQLSARNAIKVKMLSEISFYFHDTVLFKNIFRGKNHPFCSAASYILK
jgi:hypothetical protein